MTSFKNVLADSIKRKVYTRERYETLIAAWHLQNWLSEDEVNELLALLDVVFAA